ncbi:nuclear transport factor 2 family protein [Kineosporia sp. NBRC 101731]|uniref:nuclear transport factor 2 family protein n=1 Tax=Kineosporia sp. NBRC 101731 TaxID=3032199 RepID=UPI00249FE907|nr:nuclear transport factor 2 family protein [Kineosporia sp. NBRC 101731]GLY33022.1 isomerase [Kineosporia sp. NBRC 101731]
MTDWTSLAEQYLAVWNETDDTKRRVLAEELFAPTCRLTDPMVDVEGTSAIDAVIGQVQQQFTGHALRLAGAVDGHHDQVRFGWDLVPTGSTGSEAVVVGFDVLLIAPDGKLDRVLGFLDRAPGV